MDSNKVVVIIAIAMCVLVAFLAGVKEHYKYKVLTIKCEQNHAR